MMDRAPGTTIWKSLWIRERERFLTAAAATLVCGLAAHAYGFLNLTLSHDAMNEFYLQAPITYASGTVEEWKISLGRVVEPLYLRLLRGETLMPWWTGVLTLLWLTLSAWMIARIFDLKKKPEIVLVAGFLCTNLSINAMAATYMTDLDANMFAVFMAVCAVWLWTKGGWKAWLGVPLLVLTLGIYQCLLSVAVTLVIFVCMEKLIRGENCGKVLVQGLKSIGIFLAAGSLYLGLVKLVCDVSGVALRSGYNGLTALWAPSGKSFGEVLKKTYDSWSKALFEMPGLLPQDVSCVLHVLAAAGILSALLFVFFRKGISLWSKLLLAALALLLPLGMNLACFLDHGMVHQLMMYAFWLIYLLWILLLRYSGEILGERARTVFVLRGAAALVMAVLLVGNIQTANGLYVKKEQERQGTLFVMTQVVQRLEETDGYVKGRTRVAFVGTPYVTVSESFAPLYAVTGSGYHSAISSECYYANYLKYFLGYPMNVIPYSEVLALMKHADVKAMPAYPAAGCIGWSGDVLVVKVR